MDQHVITEICEGIGTITLNRPTLANVLDAETGGAFVTAVHTVCDDPSVRVVMLKAVGKIFCAGGDIGSFVAAADRLAGMLDKLLGPLHDAIHRLASSGLPVVSALNGPIGGGGIGIALCADHVLAARSMKLRGGYSAIGLSPDAGSAWFLARRAGAARAKQIFFLNRPVDAQDCLAWGIVDAVYPDEELAARADELARRLCAGPQGALARTKLLVDGIDQRSLAKHLALEREYMLACAESTDAREGISAFLERRAPSFRQDK